MAERGARKLVLSSRSGAKSSYQKWTIARLRCKQILVQVSQSDVSKREDVEKLLKEALTLGAIGGIFNLSLVLRDSLIENQTVQSLVDCCAPKVEGTRLLDTLSRQLSAPLDFFVAFSSVSCGKGNAGQANYGFANSVMERICEQRRRDGLHGLAIQWGAIGDVGFLVNAGETEELVIRGTKPQRIASCLYYLGKVLQLDAPVVCCFSPSFAKKGAKKADHGKSLLQKVAHIVGIKDKSTLTAASKQTLGELGIDSLMSIEIKQTLERGQDTVFNTQQIRQLTIGELFAMG